MIGSAIEGEIKTFVLELAWLVVIKVTVFRARRFKIEFMDGSKITV